jgi:hypothetical protein
VLKEEFAHLKREKGVENLSKEIPFKNFPNFGRDMDTQVHEAQRASKKDQPKEEWFETHYFYLTSNVKGNALS